MFVHLPVGQPLSAVSAALHLGNAPSMPNFYMLCFVDINHFSTKKIEYDAAKWSKWLNTRPHTQPKTQKPPPDLRTIHIFHSYCYF